MRSKRLYSTAVLIGSQRVNHLAELLVADLFGCVPFHALKRKGQVPFYTIYRDWDRPVPSCFGGRETLPGSRKHVPPGIYYLDENDNWVDCSWKDNEQDAGIVITHYEPGTQALEMAIFGFSGRGTACLGAELIKNPDAFWPPYASTKDENRKIGVYLCKFQLDSRATNDQTTETLYTSCQVIPLAEDILAKCMKKSSA